MKNNYAYSSKAELKKQREKMKTLKVLLILSFIFCGILAAEYTCAKGLNVSPAGYDWHDAKVGILTKCPANIMVKNDSDSVRSYTLRVVRPEDIDIKLKEGFKSLPSKRWLSFDKKRVTIGPGEWKEVKMFIEIPKEKKNFNQKWDFFVEVKEYTSGGETFALACYSRFQIITEK